MDFATLKELKIADFERAAERYRTARDMADSTQKSLQDHVIAKMYSLLDGEARDAAVEQLQKLSHNFHYVQIECGLATTALNALAADLSAAQRKLLTAVEGAQAAGFRVNSDGSVTYPAAGHEVDGKLPPGDTVSGSPQGKGPSTGISPPADANDTASALRDQASNIDPNPNRGEAVAYANRIAQAVDEARKADESWAPQLRKLKADDDLNVSTRDWLDTHQDATGVRTAAKNY
ncbi:hypothetical protein AAHZ94_32590, partial [Streptomyces sp. HSW2009]